MVEIQKDGAFLSWTQVVSYYSYLDEVGEGQCPSSLGQSRKG